MKLLIQLFMVAMAFMLYITDYPFTKPEIILVIAILLLILGDFVDELRD